MAPKKNNETKQQKKKKSVIVEYDEQKDGTIDENKYSKKLNILLVKIKNQNKETDNRIRFCWKN